MTLYFGPFVLQTAPGCLKIKGSCCEKEEKAFKDELKFMDRKLDQYTGMDTCH